jgi:hypothetical protein
MKPRRLAMIRSALAVLIFWLAFAAGPALGNQAWTFCVASAFGSREVWITSLFPAFVDRERLEREMRELIERRAHARVVAQCPQPNEDKVFVVNAQTTAEEFNRKLGAILHAVPPQQFPPR